MRQLLDRDLLRGPHEVRVGLRPYRYGRCVQSIDHAIDTIRLLCQTWGGSAHPLVALELDSIPNYLELAMTAAEVDGVVPPSEGVTILTQYLEVTGAWDFPALLIAAHENWERGGRPVQVVDIDPNDPWRFSYLGTLGWLPDVLDENLDTLGRLNDLRVDEILPIKRVATTGGLDDLLARVNSFDVLSPRQFSTLYLESGSKPDTGYLGSTRVLPSRWERARAAGPNIVVVMSPDSIDDLALLWNLRAQWGDHLPLPIGVPQDELTPDAIRRLVEGGDAITPFGLGGGALYLTSGSIALSELANFAPEQSPVRLAEPHELVSFSLAPSRSRSQVQVWTDGTTRIPSMSESDREILRAAGSHRPSLKLSVHVHDAPVPRVGTLRARFYHDFQCGAAQVQVSELSGRRTSRVRWPTTWTALTAAALDLGLEVRESQPGLQAMNLIHAIGNVRGIRYLCDKALIDLLYNLAERSGMAWWKQRWNQVEQRLRDEGRTDDAVRAVGTQLGKDDPAVAPANEGRSLTFGHFQSCFGRRGATSKWLDWAIERHLIVKGVGVRCENCRVESWFPAQEMAPPHVCPGCSRTINRPFGPDTLHFKYRIGEVLRQCLEVDAIGHVLALRWLTELFDGHGLIGAHPGVEFIRDGTVVAEADTILLFQDGSLAPVEVKRRATAFGPDAVKQLDATSAALKAQFDIMCVVEPEERCAGVAAFKRTMPNPRFLLTMDHLSQQFVLWSAGRNPFEDGPGKASTKSEERSRWLDDVELIGTNPDDAVESTVEYWRQQRSAGENLGQEGAQDS